MINRRSQRLPREGKREVLVQIAKTFFNVGILLYINLKFSPGFMWSLFPIFFAIIGLFKKVWKIKAKYEALENTNSNEYMDLREIEVDPLQRKQGWKESDLV